MSDRAPGGGRVRELDAVRGLAALVVVLDHLALVSPAWQDASRHNGFTLINLINFSPLYAIFDGTAAVILFFVLSGFVLTLSYEGGKQTYAGFLVRRVARIWVPYIFAIAVAVIGAATLGDSILHGASRYFNGPWQGSITTTGLLEHAVLISHFQNYAQFDPVIWSLSAEMRISLIFPLLVAATVALRWRWSIPIAIVIAIVGAQAQSLLTGGISTLLYVICFVVGALLALDRAVIGERLARTSTATRWALFALAMVLFTYPNWMPNPSTTHGHALHTLVHGGATITVIQTAAAAIVIVLAQLGGGAREFLLSRVPQYLGRISYSLYLLHTIVLLAVLHIIKPAHTLPWLPLVFILSIVLSDLSNRYVERPAQRLGRRVAERIERGRRPSSDAPSEAHSQAVLLGSGDGQFARLRSVPWWAWIGLLVAVEAAAILVGLPTSWSHAVGTGDGAEYQRYAYNLLHHGVFSESPIAPYHPGVVRSPGYPFFLAVIELVGGRDSVPVQIVQFALVAGTSVLVGLIGRRMASETVANVAAVLCAIYLPFLGFATAFLTETVTTFLLTAMVLMLIEARRLPTAGMNAAIGFDLAAAAYVRPECVLLAVPIALVLLFDRRPHLSVGRWTALAALSVAVVLPLVPWLIRDASVAGKFVPMEGDGGVALLASADQYDGRMSEGFADVGVWNAQVARITGVPAAAKRGIQAPVKYADAHRQVQVDAEERSRALTLFKQLSVTRVLTQLPKRVLALWRAGDETPPTGAGSKWHHLAQLQFFLLVMLGLIGLFCRRRRLLSDWPLWLVAADLTLTHLVFPIEARYTLPARPTLMIYAAVGLLWVIGQARSRWADHQRSRPLVAF
jgi:peptidoglycan/LPS O-acetylase OafA/YrhL